MFFLNFVSWHFSSKTSTHDITILKLWTLTSSRYSRWLTTSELVNFDAWHVNFKTLNFDVVPIFQLGRPWGLPISSRSNIDCASLSSAATQPETEVRCAATPVPRAGGDGGARRCEGHPSRSARHRRAVPGVCEMTTKNVP